MPIEFLDETSSGDTFEEPSGAARAPSDRRPAAWRSRALVVLALAVAVGAVTSAVIRAAGNGASPALGARSPSTAASSAVASPLDRVVIAVPPDPMSPYLDLVYRLTASTDPARSRAITLSPYYSCPATAAAARPAARAVRVIRSAMPRFRLRDVARITDQFGDVCVLQVRGAVGRRRLVVQVTGPVAERTASRLHPGAITSVIDGRARRIDRAWVSVVRFETPDHWRMLVGTAGPGSDDDAEALATIATDLRLTW